MVANHPDAPALDIINATLGGGASSRLFNFVTEENALTYDIGSGHNKGVDFGFFNINCAVKSKNLQKAKKLILKQFTDLRNQKVSDMELEKAKNMMRGSILRVMDNLQECHELMVYMELHFGKETALADYTEKLKAVTSSQILDIAYVFFQEE